MYRKSKEDLITIEGTKDARSRAAINLEKAKIIEQKRIKMGWTNEKINKGYKLSKPKQNEL